MTNENPNMRMYIILYYNNFIAKQEISETAGSACHEEAFQCPARCMSSATEQCHWDGGPRTGSDDETSCTSFWRRAVRNSTSVAKHGYDALNMRDVFRKIPRR